MPTFAQIDGVSKELTEVNTDAKELSTLSSIVDSVEKTIFEKDIMERVSRFYLKIDSNAYYTINEDGSLGTRVFINNASELTSEEYANLIGKIIFTRNGNALVIESPRRKGPSYVQIWITLCAEMKDGSSKIVTKANGFPVRDFGLNFDLYGHYATVVTPSDTNYCRRTFKVNYGDDENTEGYTNPLTGTACDQSSQNITCAPLKDQSGSYDSMFYILVGAGFEDLNGEAYYHWILNNMSLQYLDKRYPMTKLTWYSVRSKVDRRNLTTDDIIGFDVFLTKQSSISLNYRVTTNSGFTTLMSNFPSMSSWSSNWGTYSKTDTNLTINAYTGLNPHLYFIVLARLQNDKHVPLSYFSYEQLSNMNVPFTFVYTNGSTSSMDSINYLTIESGAPKYLQPSIYNALGVTYTVNANGGYYYNLFTDLTKVNPYSFRAYFYSGKGESNSQSVPSPASITRSFSISLGNATVGLSDGSTKIVPMRFRISGEAPTYLYDDIE